MSAVSSRRNSDDNAGGGLQLFSPRKVHQALSLIKRSRQFGKRECGMKSKNYNTPVENSRKILLNPEMKQQVRNIIENRDIVCYMLCTARSHFISPVSFERKYQVAEINLLNLNVVRKIYQVVAKVFCDVDLELSFRHPFKGNFCFG
jgi:hypothetical protein